MLAKGTAKGVKPKGFAGGYRQGWIALPVIRCHKHPLLHVAEVSQICLPRKTSLHYWGAWNTVWLKASSYWPTQMVLKAGEMGEGAKQWKQTSKSILVKLFEDLQGVLPHGKIKEKSFALVYNPLTEFEWTTVWPLLPLMQALKFSLQRITQEFCW